MSNFSLYTIPKYQTSDLQLYIAGYQVLMFIDYQHKQALKDFQSQEGQTRAVFVGRGTRDMHDWITAEQINYECYWSGPIGKQCELCIQFDIQEFPHYLVFKDDQLLYTSNDPPREKFSYLGINTSEEFAKLLVNDLITSLFPSTVVPSETDSQTTQNTEISQLQTQLDSVSTLCEEQKILIQNLQTTLTQKDTELSQFKKNL